MQDMQASNILRAGSLGWGNFVSFGSCLCCDSMAACMSLSKLIPIGFNLAELDIGSGPWIQQLFQNIDCYIVPIVPPHGPGQFCLRYKDSVSVWDRGRRVCLQAPYKDWDFSLEKGLRLHLVLRMCKSVDSCRGQRPWIH